MSDYRPTIGLEIHAELKTNTKMFCACRNDADLKEPNQNICPICMAHPGSLPVINRDAVLKVLLVGQAVGAVLADYTEFDRKNYFYPDIPKGYQLSQFAYPLVSGGALRGVTITRVHLEEDTARSQHTASGGERSLVDYNRAGVPLMELVTEPVIHSAQDAALFARELQLLLRTLGVGDANMEKGEMRVEANISVSKDETLGTKVEVKNLNSFRSVERAISFEVERHIALLERGESVVQETRGWDETKQITFSQRKKESSHDYRYFPDPDLPKLKLSKIPEFAASVLQQKLPELPWHKRERLIRLGFLQQQDIDQLVEDFELSDLFGKVETLLKGPTLIKIAANFILNDIVGQKKKDPAWVAPDAAFLAEVVQNFDTGVITSPQAKQAIISKQMVAALDNAALPAIAQSVIDANPTVVAEYKAGKTTVLMFLVGQGMKESKGSANPGVLRDIFVDLLSR